MEPNRLDQEFKSKLDKRVIKPSQDTWGILSNRLDIQDKNKSNKRYWLLGLAASFVGVLLIVTQFSSGVKDVINEVPNKVVTTNNDLYEGYYKAEKQNNIIEKNNVTEEAVVTEEYEGLEKDNLVERLSSNSNKAVAENTNGQIIGLKKEKQLSNDEFQVDKLTFEAQKIQDVVAQVQALKNENKVVTEADINALLVEAQKEIALNRLSQQTIGFVDANALLESVEQELDQSFRTKVFEAIKTSYNTVKTAVAQRNE